MRICLMGGKSKNLRMGRGRRVWRPGRCTGAGGDATAGFNYEVDVQWTGDVPEHD